MAMPLVDLATSGFILFTVIMQEKILFFEDVRERPINFAFEATFACEVVDCKAIPFSSPNREQRATQSQPANDAREATGVRCAAAWDWRKGTEEKRRDCRLSSYK